MKHLFTFRKAPWLMAIGLLFVSVYRSDAQVSGYTFGSSSGTFTPISGGTVLVNNAITDDAAYTNLPIGFSFNYAGTPFSNFSVSSNGDFAFGSTVTSTNYSGLNGTVNNLITGFGGDGLLGTRFTGTRTSGSNTLTGVTQTNGITVGSTFSTATGFPAGTTVVAVGASTVTMSANATSSGTTGYTLSNGQIRYELLGISPNRTLVCQWSNTKAYSTTATNGGSWTFQIRLSETSNVIQIVYGPCAQYWSTTRQVGLRGATSTDFNLRTTTTNWASSSAGASIASNLSISTTVQASNGLTYTWTPPSCSAPGAPVISALTNNSFTGTVTPGGGAINYTYNLYLGSICSGSPVSTVTPTPASLSQAFSGLLANTQYTLCVQSNCPASVTSGNASTTFTTQCDPVSIPYSTSFEVVTPSLPACFTQTAVSGTTPIQTTTSTSSTSNIGARTGSTYIRQPWNNDRWLFSPPVSLDAGQTYYLTYYFANTSTSQAAGGGHLITNAVGVSASAAAMSTTLSTISYPLNQAYQLSISTFTAPSPGVYYFGTRIASDNLGATWYLAIDDYQISDVSPCGSPGSLASTALGISTANLSWTPGALATGYNWELRSSGSCGAASPLQSGSVAGTSVSLSGLSANTTYTLCVRSDCGGSNSGWISTTFTTLCNPVSLPVTESFSATLPPCFSNSVTPKSFLFRNTVYDGITAVNGHYAYVDYSGAGSGVLISPAMDFTSLGLTQAIVRFSFFRNTQGVSADRIKVWVNTSPTLTGATALADIPRLRTLAPTESSDGWYTYKPNIPLSFNSSGNVYVLFEGQTEGSFSSYSVGIDEIYIGPPPPTTLGTVAVEQNPAGTTSVGAGSSQNPVLRINLPVDSTTGTLTLNSVQVTYTGTSAADLAPQGVKLWRTTGTAFTSPVQVGTGQDLSAGQATFSGLSRTLLNGNNYFWVTSDVSGFATEGNSVDFALGLGSIAISAAGGAAAPGTQPPANADPTGSRTIAGNLKYVFSQSITPYVENTDAGRTNLLGLEGVGNSWDDFIYMGGGTNASGGSGSLTGAGIPIGFTFNYNGVNYSQFGVSTNGFIKLGNDPFTIANSLSSGMSSTTANYSNIIAPFHRDLQGYANAELSYQTIGVAPNRQLIVQWKFFRVFNSTDAFNFQVILNESSNLVEFAFDAIPFQTRTIVSGIKGNRGDVDLSNVLTRDLTITSQIALTLPVQGSTVSGTAETMSILPGFDLQGVRHTYTPTACGLGVPTLNSFTLVTNSTATANWASNSTAFGYQIRWRTSTQDFSAASWATPVTITGSANNSYAMTGLSANSTYIVEVRNLCSAGVGTAWSPAATIFTDPAANDVAVVEMLTPTTFACYSVAQPVSARFRNVGLGAISAGTPVSLVINLTTPSGPANMFATYIPPTNVAVNATFDVSFGLLNMSAAGLYTFNPNVAWPSDGNASNNSLATPLSISAYSPYLPSPTYSIGLNGTFPTGSLFNSTIAPLNPFIPFSGSVNLDGGGSIAPFEGSGALYFDDQFFDNCTVTYITPCIEIPTCYQLQFRHSRYQGADNGRGTVIRVSTDGGNTFSGPLTVTNLTRGKTGTIALQFLSGAATPVWDLYSVDLSAYFGQDVRIAFEATTGFGTAPNWAIDDIKVMPKTVRDLVAVGLTSGIDYSVCNALSFPVSVRVRNQGCGNASNFNVSATVTGPVVGGTFTAGALFTGSLAEGASADVFLGNVLLTGNPGDLIVTGSVDNTGDNVPANNSFAATTIFQKRGPVSSLSLSSANIVVGNPATINGSVSLSSGGSYFSNNTAQNIPDNNFTGINSNIVISSLPAGTLASSLQAVSIRINHDQVGDLRVRLEAPGGNTIDLVNRRGNTGNDFSNTRFRSGTNISTVTETSAPYIGTWEPEQPFSSFGAAVANGTWRLLVDDNAAQDAGVLQGWSLEFNNQIQSASWTCPSCPSGFPVNFTTPPVTSVNFPNNPIGATYPSGSYLILLSATDAANCGLSRDTTINFFSENRWLGLSNAPAGNNWSNPSNWLASPAPPDQTVAVTISEGTPFSPTISSSYVVGSLIQQNSTNINIGTGGVLQVRANWTSSIWSSVTGDGVVRFNGTAGQVISGPARFQNLDVDKTSGSVSVTGNCGISGTLSFGPTATTSVSVAGSGRLTILSGPSGTGRIGVIPSGSTVAGNVSIQRYIPSSGKSWYLLGSPITGRNFTDWSDNFRVYGPASGFGSQGGGIWPLGIQHTTIFEYRENLHNTAVDTVQKRGWRAPANTSIEPGRGYRVLIDKASMSQPSLDNFGPLTQGNVTFPNLTRNTFANCFDVTVGPGVACTENWRGWNLLSNPYPSSIDWDAVTGWTKPLANIQNAIYRYVNGSSGGAVDYGMQAYGVYISGTGWFGATPAPASPNIIPSHQGFFVKMTSGTTGTLQATEAVKVSGAGSFAKINTNLTNALKLNIQRANASADDYGYMSMVRFMNEATDGYDPNFDFSSFGSTGFTAGFMVEGSEMVVNSMGELSSQKVVPVHTDFKGQTGSYTFSFSELSSFDSGVEIYLRDNFLNEVYNLSLTPQHTFNVDLSNIQMSGRFELVFNPSSVTGIRNIGGNAFFGVRPNPSSAGGEITMIAKGIRGESAQVTLVDMIGKVVYTGSLKLTADLVSEKTLKLNLPAGVYTLNLNSGGNIHQQKLVIR